MNTTGMTKEKLLIVTLPNTLTFKHKGIIDFDNILKLFRWDHKANSVTIDARQCKMADYQSLILLIQYIWYLKRNHVYVNLRYTKNTQFYNMWKNIDGKGCFNVLDNTQDNFHYVYNKPIFAIKYKDHNITQMLNTIRDYAMDLPTDLIRGYEDAVRYIISELTYNALEADMYIVSGDGVAHISPLDVTYTTLENAWPGTFIYMTIGFDRLKTYDLHKHLEDFRKHATETVAKRNNIVRAPELYIDMYNYCGERCEVKLEAINLRERKIIPAIQKGETVILDFSHAITATHSFLTALLADPIKILGLKSYKQIKIIGANETIRTIIDFVFDTYTN